MIFLISNTSSANILINEVMYDPDLSDNYYEWIELYNPTNEPINVSGWSIIDNSATDFLEGNFDHGNGSTIIPPKGYAIITDHGTLLYENSTIPDDAIQLYVDDSSIGNGLGNSNDKLILKNASGNEINAVEWGYDYTDVPGNPADLVNQGYSLSRYENVDTNDSSKDFYKEKNPTPGRKNIFSKISKFDIDLYPEYIPKVYNNSEYSLPFAIKINVSNFESNEKYQLKTYIVGNSSNSWPASQTWDGNSWKYSNYYTTTITTNEFGNCKCWQFIRIKNEYKEYLENIQNNSSAFLKVKIKNDNYSEEISREVLLLDMDNSTQNATMGGYAVGIKDGYSNTKGKIVVIKNKQEQIKGIYKSEENIIDENYPEIPGYYKITAPVGNNYSLIFLDNNGKQTYLLSNVTIKHGKYGVAVNTDESFYQVKKDDILSIPVTIKNTGAFIDTYKLSVKQRAFGWYPEFEKYEITLDPEKQVNVTLKITPCNYYECINGIITIIVTSQSDFGESDEKTIELEVLAPDLTIKKIITYNERNQNTTDFGVGELVRIKAYLKNIGNYDATNVDVKFYYDSVNEENFIGNKSYSLVSKYQKYPSVIWDTIDIEPKNHTIIVVVDQENYVDEINEKNNELSLKTFFYDTYPLLDERKILISEFYVHTHPAINNEYIVINNPSPKDINISSWYFTNKPLKIKNKQLKIVFPNNTILKSKSSFVVTQNANDYFLETNNFADFEYDVDSDKNISQMQSLKKFVLSNKGANIALKNSFNHTIDVVVYGKTEYNYTGWKGSPIPTKGKGVIYKRNLKKDFVDTNTSYDWINNRISKIGQSNFLLENISFEGKIRTFVSPDCSFDTIADEIRKANESIYVNMYEFTNPFICDEIIFALIRNVSVKMFLEGAPVGGITNEEKSILNRIANYGGEIRFIVNSEDENVHARYSFNHAKYLIIDNSKVIIESCNFAVNGVPKNPTYGNREWGFVIYNYEVANYFLEVFMDDWNPARFDSYSFEDMNLSVPSDFTTDYSTYSGTYAGAYSSEYLYGYFSVLPVISPDTSSFALCNLIDSAEKSIYIQQLYIYKNWNNEINPFVARLVNKSKNGVDIKVILNYNPYYESVNYKLNETKKYFEENGIEVKFIYTNWSIFSNIHNKGMIVDNKSVLISSINWNENSVMNNREAGIIIKNSEVASYYADVFFYDWALSEPEKEIATLEPIDYENTLYIVIIFTLTFALIARDWRKRQWT